MLELKNVTKKYRGKPVVNGLTLSVDEGQILGLLGSNGAGKTTTLSMIATLLKPDSGEIVYNGENIVTNKTAIRRDLGFVPQDIALYESLSGIDNLKFWADAFHVPGKERIERIEKVSDIVSLDGETLKKRVAEYSGGMKRRLNIATALLNNPKLVILDEPTVGIDIISSRLILDAIELLKTEKTAVIYASHRMEEVERISTHICILDNGRSVVFGEKDRLLNERNTALAQLYEEAISGKI